MLQHSLREVWRTGRKQRGLVWTITRAMPKEEKADKTGTRVLCPCLLIIVIGGSVAMWFQTRKMHAGHKPHENRHQMADT